MKNIASEVEDIRQHIVALNEHGSDQPTLVYFNIIGIAWPIRCLLHIKSVDYDYVPVSVMHWAFAGEDGNQVLKSCLPSGHVPLFAEKGFYSNQSILIAIHLATKHGLMGDGSAEETGIREVMSHAYDALFHFNGLLPVNITVNIDPDTAQKRLDAYMGKDRWGLSSNGYRNNLNAFVRYLQRNPADSGYMVGKDLTIADLHSFNVLCNWHKAFDRQVFTEEYPMLDEYIHRVADYPGVRDYIDTVQESTVWFPLPDISLRLNSPGEMVGLLDD